MTYRPLLKKLSKAAVISFTLSVFLCFLPSLAEENKNFNPKPASASFYNLGLKSFEQGDLESSTTFFKRAIDLDPGFVDAYYNLGAIYKKQNNFREAAVTFLKANEINPKDYEVAFELGNCYLELKGYEKAKKYYALIPPDFERYTEVKQKIELANQGLANPNLVNAPKTEEGQAQLLVNTLTKDKPTTPASQNQAQNNSQEALVNTLAASNEEKGSTSNSLKKVLKHEYKIITKNFYGPTGIAKDSKNNIYIGNFTRDSIEKIHPDGSREIFFEQNGVSGPVGLAIDESDNLYVANYNGNSIIRISPNKEVAVVIEKVVKPYYLYYDLISKKLLITVQGNDSLVEVDTSKVTKQQISSR